MGENEDRTSEMDAYHARNGGKILLIGLVLFLIGTGFYIAHRLRQPSTPAIAAGAVGPVCDAGTGDNVTMMPAFITPGGSQIILYLACDGYTAGTNGEVVIQMDGKPHTVIPFTLEPINEQASLFVTELGILPPGMYTIEFRTGGRQSRTLATTYTRVIAT